MAKTLIRGGRVLDPKAGLDETLDVLIEGDAIAAVGADLPADDAEVVDASGLWVVPGFVDMHTHLREPGEEYKEDLASGGRAAVAGGFTAIACMANTHPVNDDPSVTKYILDRAAKDSPSRVHPIAAATKGLEGKVMTEMSALVDSGAVAFSDDGATITNASVMRAVLEYSRLVDKPVIVHAEDCGLRGEGVINEGRVSTLIGLPGNPVAAEEIMVARDLRLAALTGARLHIAHVSSGGSVQLIKAAREAGLAVTAEATPHHLALTEEATRGFDTNFKMAPPLRTAADVAALRAGLVEGVIDAIATDHAPHAEHEKDVEFTAAPFGVTGFETALPICLDLVRQGEITPLELMRRMSTAPAAILQIEGGGLGRGETADVALIDPEARWIYDPATGFSKSRNSPWAGQEMHGRVRTVWVAGRRVHDLEPAAPGDRREGELR